MIFTKRLKDIASLVNINSTVIDIGCDHAYLPIYLVLNKISNKVYAVDNKVEPLNSAIKNIKEYHLENSIIPILSDGLKNVSYKDFDTITISGMGGDTMKEILINNDTDSTLILEPNTNHYSIRKFLMESGYEIEDELISRDKDFFYIIIKAKKAPRNVSYSMHELHFGPILLRNKPQDFIDYINKFINDFEKNLSKTDSVELRSKIDFYKEALTWNS